MQRLLADRRLVAAVVLVLVVLLLVAQLLAASTAPTAGVSSEGASVGRATFAYLGGLRTFAAAVIWNRLDPQHDTYFRNQRFKDLTFLLPSIYFVQRLDPQFEQAYYVAGYLLAQRKMWDEAYRVAQEGIANNPTSGLLRANYVQILITQDKAKNLRRALGQARLGIGPNITYANSDDEFESLGVFQTVFTIAGDKAVVSAIAKRRAELVSQGAKANSLVRGSTAPTPTAP